MTRQRTTTNPTALKQTNERTRSDGQTAKQEQIDALRAMLRTLEEQNLDLRRRLDDSEEERKATTRLLTDQRPRRSWLWGKAV